MTRDEILNMEAGRERLEAFYLERIDKRSSDDCWNWTGSICKQTGYGEGSPSHNKKYLAHRLAYELYIGNIPANMTIDHICRNRQCANPLHLRLLSNRENILCGTGITANNSRKSYCPHGHEYSGSNLYTKPNGARICRICKRESDKRRRTIRSEQND